MEKINLAELLKDCPQGMELDCTMYDNVKLDYVLEGNLYPIKIQTPEGQISLNKYGCYSNNKHAKCVIFPKGRTTWEGFQIPFKDGDIVTYDGDTERLQIFIFKDKKENDTLSTCYLMLDGDELDLEESAWYVTRLATEEEKQKLFDVIKANGYKWNAETKVLEKLVEPKFKVGDEIVKRNSISNSWIVSSVSSEYYGLKLPKGVEGIGVLPVSEQDDWELILNIKPKFKVGDRIKYIYFDRKVAKVIKIHDKRYELDNGKFIEFQDENAYEIYYDKFDIATLKPFDKVLMRSSNAREWTATLYSDYKNGYFYGCGMMCQQCIPYKGNEYLLGTTEDCNEYYKTWK